MRERANSGNIAERGWLGDSGIENHMIEPGQKRTKKHAHTPISRSSPQNRHHTRPSREQVSQCCLCHRRRRQVKTGRLRWCWSRREKLMAGAEAAPLHHRHGPRRMKDDDEDDGDRRKKKKKKSDFDGNCHCHHLRSQACREEGRRTEGAMRTRKHCTNTSA